MRKWFKRLGLTTLLIAAVGVATLAYLALASRPQTAGEIVVGGLEAPVAIARDAFGIPEISASSESDLYFGIGYAHAQDRLWQMEFSRRVGAGRLSEILGEDALGIDRFMRTLGLVHVARANLEALPQDARRGLEAYASGVNAYLADPNGPLPPEFSILWTKPEPWKPEDSILMIKLLAFDLSKNWRDESARMRLASRLSAAQLADLFPSARPIALGDMAASSVLDWLEPTSNEGLGSNIWAANGNATRSGAAILANDPHLALRAPGTWYWARINAPDIRAIVATIPALPTAVIGRNEHIAWGFTNSGADIQDLILETVSANTTSSYLTEAGAKPFVERIEEIKVRGGTLERLVVRETRHGPVLSDINPPTNLADDQALALQWTALLQDDRTIAAGFRLLKAKNFDAFEQAIAFFDSPPQNVIYADRDGHIGQLLAGRIPIRAAGDGRFAEDGASADRRWHQFIPNAEKPRRVDPPSGILANANNRIVNGDYAHHLTMDWDSPLRFNRIQAQLTQAPNDLHRMQALQNDRHSQLAAELRDLLLAAAFDNDIAQALRDWDLQMSVDRPEPVIFLGWYREFQKLVLEDELGENFKRYRGMRTQAMLHIVQNAQHWCDRQDTDPLESCEDMASHAFAAAMAELQLRYGRQWQSWRWGEAGQVHIAHQPFSRVPGLNTIFDIHAQKGGGPSSPNVARFATADPFATIVGPSMRLIVDWSDPQAAHLISATGQSGHPLSPHYRDMTELWAKGELLRIVLPETQPEGHCANSDKNCLLLIPIGGQFESKE